MTSNKRRKSSSNFKNVQLEDDYKDINLIEYKEFLTSKILEYEKHIKKLKEEVKSTNFYIAKKCEDENKEHEWVSEREPVLYGERYTFCKECGVDYYDRTYLHK